MEDPPQVELPMVAAETTESSIDESIVTGESLPIDKKIGQNVIGSTINQNGILYVKATKVGKDTFLSHVIKLVQEAQGSKIPIQAFGIQRQHVPVSIFMPVATDLDLITRLLL